MLSVSSMHMTRTGTMLTAAFIIAVPVARASDDKHLDSEDRRDRAAEYGRNLAVAPSTATAVTSPIVFTVAGLDEPRVLDCSCWYPEPTRLAEGARASATTLARCSRSPER
jgi:hypothetical protein